MSSIVRFACSNTQCITYSSLVTLLIMALNGRSIFEKVEGMKL